MEGWRYEEWRNGGMGVGRAEWEGGSHNVAHCEVKTCLPPRQPSFLLISTAVVIKEQLLPGKETAKSAVCVCGSERVCQSK